MEPEGLSQREITHRLPEGLPDRLDHHTEEVLSWHIEQVVNPNTGCGYDLATIKRDLQELEESWRRDATRDFAELKAQHLASIRYGIRVAWAQDKLYYVSRGLELEAAVLGLHEPDEAGGRIYVLLGADEYSPGDAHVTTRAPGKPRTAPPNSSPSSASSCRLSARPTPRRGGYWPPSSGSRP